MSVNQENKLPTASLKLKFPAKAKTLQSSNAVTTNFVSLTSNIYHQNLICNLNCSDLEMSLEKILNSSRDDPYIAFRLPVSYRETVRVFHRQLHFLSLKIARF